MEKYQAHRDKSRILLVDDDFINREMVKNIFHDQFSFVEAENGREGLAKAEEFQDSLCAILLDVNMPEMDGIELLRILHARGIPEHTPVFLITAHDEQDIAREAYELGVMDVVNKPIVPYVIRRRIQSVVELYQAREQLSATVMDQKELLQENADTIDELHRGTIEALASAIEFRDVESGEHTARIYSVTKYILSNTEMGANFSQEDIENMAVGSIMHDVGKIAISDVILNKPGRLSVEEFEIIKSHTTKGYRLISQLSKIHQHDSYLYASDIALHHHERWDGRGYPDGLKEDEITPWSQVVSIADVYDALISPRVYKPAIEPDRAVEMIRNGECGVFGPKLLKCFLQVEPELRKLYFPEMGAPKEGGGSQAEGKVPVQESEICREVNDVLLLMTAVQSAYDMIIRVNLTRNYYSMLDYDRFLTHCAGYDGVFDDLISAGASSVPQSHRQAFVDTFSRESLLAAYDRGERAVSLEHPQLGDDGRVHQVVTEVLLMQDGRTGDILEITLSRYLDKDRD